ncbi:Estradiol 17-beta-dehydrogenase 8 [Toxocara canis]|uniref:(3R)-3-hydroxyacyl-CoA dehydrogenase n=1 Tax=Toxocara canis TaxID=6265 RepID=A0A0B2VZG7_TOXCA|nr:Estradiol 17-beta-dehydrogenase 8 [Toxocara canis]
MAKLLAGKFGIVTGGGSGIGRAICNRLADHGAKLIVVDQSKKSAEEVCASLKSHDGAKHTAFKCDVGRSGEVKSLVDFALKQNSGTPPHIVVNSAGIIRDAEFLKMTEQQFDEVVNVNLKGTYLVTQAFAKLAVESKTPQSVINISSILGKTGAAERVNYAATKAGVIGFTKSVAAALAKNGVRVNALLPGYITTPMTDAIVDKLLAAACAQIPMGHMGEPMEIADAVVFLASDWSTYMTGAALEVTGGLGM